MDTSIFKDDDLIRTEDGLVFNPYNPLNVKIALHDVQSILAKYNIPPVVENMALYERAFVHRSYTKRPQLENAQQNITIVDRPPDCLPLSSKSNERLEFLGDGVLECVTKYYLYRRFPKENEGFMTDKKIAVVKNEAIGRIAYEMGLHRWLIISKHAEEKKIRTNLKKLGCLFEAFLGALFLDFNKRVVRDSDGWFQDMFVTGPGFQMAQKFIENVFEQHIDWIALIQNDDNYKNILQVKIQKEFKVTPSYVIHRYDAEAGYHMGVYLFMERKRVDETTLPNNASEQLDDVFWYDSCEAHDLQPAQAISMESFASLRDVHEYYRTHKRIFLFFGDGKHKIKRKAEQLAAQSAITRFFS